MRRQWLSVVALVLALSVIAFAALPQTDTFTRANAGTLGANWTDSQNGFHITSNSAYANASADNISFWNADAFTNDQYSQATIAAFSGASGVVCRMSGTSPTQSGYLYHNTTSTATLYKIVSGTYTSLTSGANSAAATHVQKITCVGTTITAYYDGSSILSTTDSAVASGSAGIYGSTANASSFSTWTGDNIGGGGGVTPSFRLLLGCCDVALHPGQGAHRVTPTWGVGQIERPDQQDRAADQQAPVAQGGHTAADYSAPAATRSTP